MKASRSEVWGFVIWGVFCWTVFLVQFSNLRVSTPREDSNARKEKGKT